MARSRFVVNHAGFRQLANRNQTQAHMLKVAQRIADGAMARGGRFTEGYRAIPIQVDGTAGARAGTDHPFAHWDEWGNRYRLPRAPLRKTLAALGLLSKTQIKGKGS